MASEHEPRRASFWATAHWTLWELALCPAAGLAFGVYIAFRRPEPVYGRFVYAAVSGLAVTAGCVACWVLFPLFTAWTLRSVRQSSRRDDPLLTR